MSSEGDLSTEESGSTTSETSTTKEPRAFLRVARKDLTEDDLGSAGVRRFLIAEIERLDEECSILRALRDESMAQRIEIAELKAALKSSKAYEVMSFACLTAGSAGIGAAISYLVLPQPAPIGWVVLVMSGLLLAAGILARVFK